MLGHAFLGFFERNFSALSTQDQEKLLKSAVLVIGCGGLGGYVLEILARIGVGRLIFADGDRFEQTNLNRQILATTENLGKNKAKVAKHRIEKIAPYCKPMALEYFIGPSDISKYARSVELIVDAVDGVETKVQLIKQCQGAMIPVVTGAVAGFEGFVSSVLPSGKSPIDFFCGRNGEGAENLLGTPAPTVSMIGTLQAYEAISYICWGRFYLENKVCYISLRNFSFDILKL